MRRRARGPRLIVRVRRSPHAATGSAPAVADGRVCPPVECRGVAMTRSRCSHHRLRPPLTMAAACAFALLAAAGPARAAAPQNGPGAPRRPARAPPRTSTWPARTASARHGTPRRRSGTRSPTACCPTCTSRPSTTRTCSTLQYVVTDGSTFTDLQTRDMTYTVSADPTGMACTVTSTDAKHGYRLATTYVTDPARDTVLMHTELTGVPGAQPRIWPLCTSTRGSTRTSTATAAAGPTTRAATPASRRATAPPVVSNTSTTSPRPRTATTRCRPTWR